MMPRKAKEQTAEVSHVDQIKAYLQNNKDDHYNFEEQTDYVVSSGSLVLDIEMSGGIRPGIIRASGVTEGGKTSCALAFARNFQKLENSMVVYVKSEGRLSKEMVQRAGIDEDERKWLEYKSNTYESVINLIRALIKDNKHKVKYMFIIDSMDSLVPKADLQKGPEDANKVAAGALLSSDFLRKMALALTTRGHICFMVSQVRAKVSLNPYEKTDPKITNASGGNALLHYSDWILEFQERFKKDLISKGTGDKEEAVGHWCKVVFKKTPNEKTGSVVKYPIRYGRTGGKSIWAEYEVVEVLLAFDMAKKSGAWVSVSDDLIEEIKNELSLEMPKQHQGIDNFKKFFEDNEEIGKYLFNKFREVLKK